MENTRRKRTEMDSAVVERLKAAMVKAGINATELSRLAGLPSEGHVGLILTGKVASPAATTMAALARPLGVSLDWLMFGDAHPSSDPPPPDETTAVRARADVAPHEASNDPATKAG